MSTTSRSRSIGALHLKGGIAITKKKTTTRKKTGEKMKKKMMEENHEVIHNGDEDGNRNDTREENEEEKLRRIQGMENTESVKKRASMQWKTAKNVSVPEVRRRIIKRSDIFMLKQVFF